MFGRSTDKLITGNKPATAAQAATQLGPEDALAHMNLGALLGGVEEDYAGAGEEYRTATRLDPEHAFAHCNLGNLLKVGQPAERREGGLWWRGAGVPHVIK